MSSITSAKLLTALRDTLKNQSLLRSIKTYKRGVFYPNVSFPVLAILPKNERVYNYLSSRKVWYERSFSFQVYCKNVDQNEAKKQAITLIERIKQTLQTRYDNIHDNIYDIDFGKTTYPQYKTSYGVADLDVFIKTEEDREEAVSFSDSHFDISNIKIGSLIHDSFVRARKTGFRNMGKLNGLFFPSTPTIANEQLPAILISPLSDTKDRDWVGLDSSANDFYINTYTRLADKELNLLYLLELTESAKRLLWRIERLAGRSYNAEIVRIDYASIKDPLLYHSRILFRAESRETIPA